MKQNTHFTDENERKKHSTTPLRVPATVSWWRGLVHVRFAPDGEARSRPGVTVAGGTPCTERYWSKLLHRLGHVTYLHHGCRVTESAYMLTFVFVAGPRSAVEGVFVAGPRSAVDGVFVAGPPTRWMASSLLATGSCLVFFGMLTLHEAGQWGGSSACWRWTCAGGDEVVAAVGGRGGRRLPELFFGPAGMQRQVPAVLGLEVPQIHFIDSGWTFLLCCSDVYPQCKLCR